jgi:signal transduction histidine kinase
VARRFSVLICHDGTELNPVFQLAEERFGLAHDVMQEMLSKAFEHVQEIADTLRVTVNREEDVIELLEKANSTLTRLAGQIPAEREAPCQEDLPCFESLEESGPNKEAISLTLEAVSHELRNPLVVVGGLARRLAKVVDPSSSGGRYLECMLDEVLRLEGAIKEMERRAGLG